jgi:Sortase domain
VSRTRANLTGPLATLMAGMTVIVVGMSAVELARAGAGPSPQKVFGGTVAAAGVDMPLATPLLFAAHNAGGPPGVEVAAEKVSPPARIQIPAIRVDARLGQVGLQSDGTIAVPADWNQPAWYADGPAPGVQGPAVIVGHLDSNTGPAVFWKLATLTSGEAILITRQDGSLLRYHVTSVGTFARSKFPTAEVYGPTRDSALRLITCGGSFDWTMHRYLDNVVVFAEAG